MIRLKGNIPEQLGIVFQDYLFNYKYKDEIKERLIFCFEQISKQKFEQLTYSDYMNWFFKNCIIENNEMIYITNHFFNENKDNIFYNMMPIWYKEKKDMIEEEIKCIFTLYILYNLYEKSSYEEVLFLNVHVLKKLDKNIEEFINDNLFKISKVSLFENPFAKNDISSKIKNLKNKLNKVKVEELFQINIKRDFYKLIEINFIPVTSTYQKERTISRKSSYSGFETTFSSTGFETVYENKIFLNLEFYENNVFEIHSVLIEKESKKPFLLDNNLNIDSNKLKFSNSEKDKISKQVNAVVNIIFKMKKIIEIS